MKARIFLVVVMFCFVSITLAQDGFKLSEVSTNIGKGAFTSGFDITLKFEDHGDLLNITGNHQRVYAAYFWDIPLSINFGISGGFFKNMPWAGPYITFQPTKFLSFLYWSGWGAGEPDDPKKEINFFFWDPAVFLTLGRFEFAYVYSNFLGEKCSLPGISYKIPINTDFKMFIGADYQINEDEKKKDEPLFRMGVVYSPK